MILNHSDNLSEGIMRLSYEESNFGRHSFKEHKEHILTIAWNRGEGQEVAVDDTIVTLKDHEVMVLNANQSFSFERPEVIVAWQFNREFYCIIDHDDEVSCAGLLFYGHNGVPKVSLDEKDQRRLNLLFQVFLDEYDEVDDNLKTEMLRVILKRLIVKLTRTYKIQAMLSNLADKDTDVIRHFNLLVEKNYKRLHQVQDYADLLNKSPKTISNLFSKYSSESPLEVIHNRLLLEAKRLLIYTDKTTKEIARETGFQEIPSFSRFFKKHTQYAPSQYRETHKTHLIGKN